MCLVKKTQKGLYFLIQGAIFWLIFAGEQKLAWFVHGPGQGGSTVGHENRPEHHQYPSTVHQ